MHPIIHITEHFVNLHNHFQQTTTNRVFSGFIKHRNGPTNQVLLFTDTPNWTTVTDYRNPNVQVSHINLAA